MDISITPVKIEEKQILKNLGELYIYELSQYTPINVDASGLYNALDEINLYWTEKNRHPFFIKVDGKLAGFALIFDGRQIEAVESDYAMDEFFIMHLYKHKGVGKYCARHLFDRFKGKWQLWLHPNNIPAKHFWTKAVHEYTNVNYEVRKNDVPFYDGMVGETYIFDS